MQHPGLMATPQHRIQSGFGYRSTAAEVLEGVDLSGRLAIVTGGYSDLGLETTRALAGAGAQVVVPARRRAHAAEVLALALGDRAQHRLEVDDRRAVDRLELADAQPGAGDLRDGHPVQPDRVR